VRLTFALLGTFTVCRDGQQVRDFRAQRVCALLAYLVLEADRPHEREHLCALLWPDEPLTTALTNLRQVLHRLRQAIEPADAEGEYLLITRQTVQINAQRFQSDIGQLRAALQSITTHKHRSVAGCALCSAHLQTIVPLYRGDLLPGFSLPESELFEHWLYTTREALRTQFGTILDHVAAHYERHANLRAALPLLQQWIELDPWNESAQLRLIRAYAQSGQRTAALRQFAQYRTILANELSIAPSADAQHLYIQVQTEQLPKPQPPLLHHEPFAHTPFFGREHELITLVNYLNDPACRLITITGMGGSGKTRLALAAAQSACTSFAQGALVIELAAVDHVEQIIDLLARALDLPPQPNTPLRELLRQRLQSAELLLVCDNCEHLPDLADFVCHLLREAPHLTILATSRMPLDLRTEWLLPIDGLALPSDAAARPDSYAAGQLFLQVAQQCSPLPPLTPANGAQIAACCQLLNGNPLAIKLAASHLRHTTLPELVALLQHDLAHLSTTKRDVPLRQRSLHAVFDWSWRLLDPCAQHALIAMTVFRGGCEPSAAEAVISTLAPIQQIVSASLIRQLPGGRFFVHEQIRQFAAQTPTAAPILSYAAAAHCRYYLALAADVRTTMQRTAEAQSLTQLQVERENLHSAWEYAPQLADWPLLQQAIPVYARIYARTNLHEGARQFLHMLERIDPQNSAHHTIRKALLDPLIGLLNATDQLATAHTYLGMLHDLAHATNDSQSIACALVYHGDLATQARKSEAAWYAYAAAEQYCAHDQSERGRSLLAQSLLKRAGLIDWQQLPVDLRYAERAYQIYAQLQMPFQASNALNRLGNQHRHLGQYGQSLQVRQQALKLIADQGDLDVGPGTFNDAGELYMLLGDYPAARSAFERGLLMAQRLGLVRMELCILEGLGRTLFHLGERELAYAQLSHALARDPSATATAHQGYCLTSLGYVAEASGNWLHANDYYSRALVWWERSSHRSDAHVEPRCGLARVAVTTHQIALALSLIEPVLPYLDAPMLLDALEPMWVHLTCVQVLQAANDPRADQVLLRAQQRLHQQAAHIHDPELQYTFLQNVAYHRALIAAQPREGTHHPSPAIGRGAA
jgi:DNA-binding SARP family transcriptional activator